MRLPCSGSPRHSELGGIWQHSFSVFQVCKLAAALGLLVPFSRHQVPALHSCSVLSCPLLLPGIPYMSPLCSPLPDLLVSGGVAAVSVSGEFLCFLLAEEGCFCGSEKHLLPASRCQVSRAWDVMKQEEGPVRRPSVFLPGLKTVHQASRHPFGEGTSSVGQWLSPFLWIFSHDLSGARRFA